MGQPEPEPTQFDLDEQAERIKALLEGLASQTRELHHHFADGPYPPELLDSAIPTIYEVIGGMCIQFYLAKGKDEADPERFAASPEVRGLLGRLYAELFWQRDLRESEELDTPE